jgi:hypothetical protein
VGTRLDRIQEYLDSGNAYKIEPEDIEYILDIINRLARQVAEARGLL